MLHFVEDVNQREDNGDLQILRGLLQRGSDYMHYYGIGQRLR